MNYLELINSVLTRLREPTISQGQLTAAYEVGGDVYIRMIGAQVNDAKRQVEQAWKWGALRTNQINPLTNTERQVFGSIVLIEDSADKTVDITSVSVIPNNTGVYSWDDPYVPLRWTNLNQLYRRYQGGIASVPKGQPQEFTVRGNAAGPGGIFFPPDTTGDTAMVLYPPPTDNSGVGDYWINISYWANQNTLVAWDDRLKVPSLPVYSLATALASRERGEVGGTPVQELMAQADHHLSDAIAYDSSLYANELDWWANDQEYNSNVRFA
jgi:hypothetical protein